MTEVVIKPQKGWIGINFKELWHHRELFYIFVWRDIKVKYKQTVIGVAWAVLQPFLMMVVFSVFFGKLAHIPSDNAPYPVFVFTGLLFWNYFSQATTAASNTLVEYENMIKKVYFPRLILPIAAVLTPALDFLIAYALLFCIMLYYHFAPHLLGIALIPLLFLLTVIASSGLGLFLAAINVKYRDVRYALPFFIQILLFVTPVIYPTSVVSANYKWILALNPMAGVIEVARATLLGSSQSPELGVIVTSGLSAVALFIAGAYYFRKTERFFADIA